MQGTGRTLVLTGGNEFSPLNSDSLAYLAPNDTRRTLRGGKYVSTIVDTDFQIGGPDAPTRLLIIDTEEIVASEGHTMRLYPGCLYGRTADGTHVESLMLSGKKVHDEYPGHWLNTAEWAGSPWIVARKSGVRMMLLALEPSNSNRPSSGFRQWMPSSLSA